MSEQRGKIHEAIAAVMADVGGVAKTRRNEQQHYTFRGIADVYLACQPVMARHGVHLTPHAVLHEDVRERATRSGGLMIHIRMRIEFRLYATDGSWVQIVTTGEAMDSGDKASNKAMSAAVKYALIQAFSLPEDDPEADTESASPQAVPQRQPQPQPQQRSTPGRPLDATAPPVPPDGVPAGLLSLYAPGREPSSPLTADEGLALWHEIGRKGYDPAAWLRKRGLDAMTGLTAAGAWEAVPDVIAARKRPAKEAVS